MDSSRLSPTVLVLMIRLYRPSLGRRDLDLTPTADLVAADLWSTWDTLGRYLWKVPLDSAVYSQSETDHSQSVNCEFHRPLSLHGQRPRPQGPGLTSLPRPEATLLLGVAGRLLRGCVDLNPGRVPGVSCLPASLRGKNTIRHNNTTLGLTSASNHHSSHLSGRVGRPKLGDPDFHRQLQPSSSSALRHPGRLLLLLLPLPPLLLLCCCCRSQQQKKTSSYQTPSVITTAAVEAAVPSLGW